MENDFLKRINEEIDEFTHKSIQVVPGFDFNQKNALEKIYRYYNSKFENGDMDADGDKKYFYNIVKNPCKVTTKAIDFDTKDIRILTADGNTPFIAWLMERDLKFWMNDKNFGKVLNRIFTELPIFGSVVLKVIKGVPYFVDLRNFVVNQSADNLEECNYIIEKHLYTPQGFLNVAKKAGWDSKKVKEAMEEFRKMKDIDYILVYERYGEVGEGEEGNRKYSYKRIIVADVGVDEYDTFTRELVPHKGVILDEKDVDDNPYWEFHLDKLPGRWLGVGVVESLFDPQIRENEIANLQAKASYWLSLLLFQTRDQTIARNLMTDVRNGEVLKVDSEVTQILMNDRNLAHFNEETGKWLKNRDELSLAYDVIQGERLPAGTPLGSAQLAASMSLSYFAQLRENIALDVKEFLYEVIIPKFKSDNSAEHYLRLVGEDLNAYNELITAKLIEDEIISFSLRKMTVPTQEDYDLLKAISTEEANSNKERVLKIVDGMYDDFKYKIKIEITGEGTDTSGQDDITILQAITTDPTILQDPVKRKIFFKILEKRGFNIADFQIEKPIDIVQLAQQMPGAKPMPTSAPKGAGGGVSAPATMATSAPAVGTEQVL